MTEITLYVKSTSNYQPGMPLQTFTVLSREWSGRELDLPLGGKRKKVVGWSSLLFGSACTVHVVRVRTGELEEGYLVYGGDSGLRILDERCRPIFGIDDHLPRGYGMPIIWVEDISDFPIDVRATVSVREDS